MLTSKTIRRFGALALAAVGLAASPQAAQAQRRDRGTIPANTVVRLQVTSPLNSSTARQGDRFMAALDETDRSGFPEGSRFVGVVREARRHTGNRPGMLDVELRRVILPDNTRVTLTGRLASLDTDNVRQTEEGRLEARRRAPNANMEWNWSGYGADNGPILYRSTGNGAPRNGSNGTLNDVLDRVRGGNNRYRDVALVAGTKFGMRLNEEVVFEDRRTYRYGGHGDRRFGDGRDGNRDGNGDGNRDGRAGNREEERFSQATVRFNSRAVELGSRPRNVNGALYVPLQAIARAANLEFAQRAGQESFTLTTDGGRSEAFAGQTRVTRTGRTPITLTEAPLLVGGVIYVSTDYLEHVANLHADWDRTALRLDLQNRR